MKPQKNLIENEVKDFIYQLAENIGFPTEKLHIHLAFNNSSASDEIKVIGIRLNNDESPAVKYRKDWGDEFKTYNLDPSINYQADYKDLAAELNKRLEDIPFLQKKTT